MNILVTGCAGFIGSVLCEKLLENHHKVVGIDNFDTYYSRQIKENNISTLIKNSYFTFYEEDIRNESAVEDIFQNNKIDSVIHLAAKAGVRSSFIHPEDYIDVNINGTKQILDNMQKFNVKNLIFASSSSVYGNYEKTPFNENYADLVPISPDAQTKLECEKIIKTYTDKYNLSAVCLRFFTVYGRRQRPDLAIAKFINAIINDKTIQIYGDGLTYRDYTHIDDIVSGIISSLLYVERERKNIFEIINIGSGSPIKLIDMVNMIEAALNKKAKTEYLPLQLGDVNITYADINKAKRLLNYEPKISFEYGLNSFVKEFLKTGIQEY